MKKLSYYLKQHIPGYLFAILSMVIAVSLDLLTPQVTRHIVDDVLVGGQMGKLKYLLLAILLIGIGRCIFQYTKEFTFDKISSTIATDMRRDLFAHIQSLSADFFDKTSTGELMARVKDDIDRIWNALGYVGMLMMALNEACEFFLRYSKVVRDHGQHPEHLPAIRSKGCNRFTQVFMSVQCIDHGVDLDSQLWIELLGMLHERCYFLPALHTALTVNAPNLVMSSSLCRVDAEGRRCFHTDRSGIYHPGAR